MNKIQLIGAYTDIGPLVAVPIFDAVHKALEARGWEVYNPCIMVPENTSWGDAMKITIDNLKNVDAVYLINNWVKSKGSVLEVKESIILGLDLYNQYHAPKNLRK